MHSPYVKQMLRSVCNSIITKDWIELINCVLKPVPQSQWSNWFREKAMSVEQWTKARGREISQRKTLGDRDYATIERQAVYDDHTLDL